jgi:hypothetical protein
MKLEDIVINIGINNDSRESKEIVLSGVFYNAEPVDMSRTFEIDRRERGKIIPSDVKSKSILTENFTHILPMK